MTRQPMYAKYIASSSEVIRVPKPYKLNIPDIKPLSFKTGSIIFGGVAAIGLGMGAVIGTYIFFGVVTLAGLVALIASNKYLKHFVKQSTFLVDMIIFGATLYATAMLGVTITAALTVAGLGYTLVVAPYLREH